MGHIELAVSRSSNMLANYNFPLIAALSFIMNQSVKSKAIVFMVLFLALVSLWGHIEWGWLASFPNLPAENLQRVPEMTLNKQRQHRAFGAAALGVMFSSYPRKVDINENQQPNQVIGVKNE